MTTCVFCRIVAGAEPATVLYRDDRAMVIVPLGSVTEGHAIALPYQHATDFTDSWLATSDAVHAAFQYARTLGTACNLITSKGREATQSVFHLHVHVVPRRDNDGLALPWYSGRRRAARAVAETAPQTGTSATQAHETTPDDASAREDT